MEDKMYVKFGIKNHYDRPSDIVSRELYRAFTKLGNQGLIEDDKSLIYGYVVDSEIHELITGKVLNLPLSICDMATEKDILDLLKSFSKKDIGRLSYLIRMIVFGEKVDINFMEVSTMEERAHDRGKLFDEYVSDRSNISPYDKNHLHNYDDLPTRKR